MYTKTIHKIISIRGIWLVMALTFCSLAFVVKAEGSKVTVAPTGDAVFDPYEVSAAINGGTGPSGTTYPGGGKVVLAAKNNAGEFTAFNFGNSSVLIEQDVVIQGEKLPGSVMGDQWDESVAANVEFNIPGGILMSDRTVVYGGGSPTKYSLPAPFRVVSKKNVVFTGLRLDHSNLMSISIKYGGDDGITVCDNVITNVQAVPYGSRKHFAFGVGASEYPKKGTIIGDIIVENNYIDLNNSGDGYFDIFYCVNFFAISERIEIYIRNNTLKGSPGGIWWSAGPKAEGWIQNNNISTDVGIDILPSIGQIGEVHVFGNTICAGKSGDLKGAGIRLGSINDSQIIGNTIDMQNGGIAAIMLAGGTKDNNIEKNTFKGSASRAIYLDGSSNNNNIFDNNYGKFISIDLPNPDYDGDGNNFSDIIMELESGVRGEALNIPSAGYLDLKAEHFTPEDHIPSEAWTVAAWVNCQEAKYHEIFTARSSEALTGFQDQMVHLELYSKHRFRWTLVAYGNQRVFDLRKTGWTSNNWHFIAGTYDKTTGVSRMYYDREVTEIIVDNPIPSSVEWQMGALLGLHPEGIRQFRGLMDEFCIFSRTLCESEISDLSSDGPNLSDPNLFAYYSFDEGTVITDEDGLQTVYDLSGAGHHGYVNPHFLDPASPFYEPQMINGTMLYSGPFTYDNSLEIELLADGDDDNGLGKAIAGTTVESSVPEDYALYQNQPNPFNPKTRIEYSLPEDSHVRIMVYNTLGQLVKVLVDGSQPKGYHSLVWNAIRHSSGIYFYRMETEGYTATRKMYLLK